MADPSGRKARPGAAVIGDGTAPSPDLPNRPDQPIRAALAADANAIDRLA